ncbi:peptidoglycan DD-metalloendopeptidase family protein [Streptomyces sp. NPDC091266]|uniref:M23 family metallopeptidase n=1 Tax=Streptomyces sp. NPDC091266 TaxID=3365978 RepID=UPI003802CDB5
MNDRHPSEAQPPTGPASDASYAHYPVYDPYGQQHSPSGCAEFGDGDPLFGSLPGSYETGMYDTGTYAAQDTQAYGTGTYATGTYDTGSGGYDTGAYPAGGYASGAYDTGTFTGGAFAPGQYDTGSYDLAGTGAYDTGAYAATGAQQTDPGYDPYAHTAYEAPAYDTTGYDTTAAHGSAAYGQPGYDTGAYATVGHDGGYPGGAYDTGSFPTGAYDTGSYPTAYGTQAYDTAEYGSTAVEETGSFEATAVWATTDQGLMANIPAQAGPPADDSSQWETTTWGQGVQAAYEPGITHDGADSEDDATAASPSHDSAPSDDAASVADAMTQAMPVAAMGEARIEGPAVGKAVRGRGRRRTVKRSALLTVAVPSVAAMGVCAVAAASVSGLGAEDKDEKSTQAASSPDDVKPSVANNKLDTQLTGLSRGADDFADRANRTQERIDLKERQALEKKRKAEEAARKEAARPKFVLPVKQHGLSALFGQAGVNWMSVHTGIDFPVSYGTPVMAATDGTVRTQLDSAYGNMAIVTAPDGTETWYCHLSSTKIRSGSVKAGDQIAYSGNSGNSTGPHMHFEVRPGGNEPINPLPWLTSHGLDPN